MGLVLWLPLAVFSFLVYRYFIHPLFFSPLRFIPSPNLLASCTPLWIKYATYKNHRNRAVHTLHEQYGPIVRVGREEVSICGIEAVKTVYLGNFDKSSFYDIFTNYNDVPNQFSLLHKESHSSRKRIVHPRYSKSAMTHPGTIDLVTGIVSRLVSVLMDRPPGKPVEMCGAYTCFTLDVITAFQFGAPLGTNTLEDPNERDKVLSIFADRRTKSSFFWLSQTPSWVSKIMIPAPVQAANGTIEAWCMALCDKADELIRLRPGGEKMDDSEFLSVWESLRTGRRAEIPKIEAASEVLDHIGAGFETTGLTLMFLTQHLLHDPGLQRELHEQLLVLPSDATWREIDQLEYLDAFILEMLRVHPVIPGQEPRLVPPGGATLEGKFIPGGTEISMQVYTMNRNPTLFPAPEKFDPFRWISASPEKLKAQKEGFVAFGMGARGCVGRELALMEIKLVIWNIWRRWKVVEHERQGGRKIVMGDGYTPGIDGHHELWVAWEEWDDL